MSISTEREEIRALIIETFRADLGGDASVGQIMEAVDPKFVGWMGDYARRKWLMSEIRIALRDRDAAHLPIALSAGGGRYVDREIAGLEEFVGAAKIRVKQGDGQYAEAQRLLDEAYRVHGVRVTLAEVRHDVAEAS